MTPCASTRATADWVRLVRTCSELVEFQYLCEPHEHCARLARSQPREACIRERVSRMPLACEACACACAAVI